MAASYNNHTNWFLRKIYGVSSFYDTISEVPGVARGNLKTLEKLKILTKKGIFSLCYSHGTQGFPQQISANLVQPFATSRLFGSAVWYQQINLVQPFGTSRLIWFSRLVPAD